MKRQVQQGKYFAKFQMFFKNKFEKNYEKLKKIEKCS